MVGCRSAQRTHWRWFPSEERPRGVVSVIHGLNNRPGAMDALIGPLNAGGFHVLRLSLHDYAEAPEHVDGWWCDAIRRGHAEARNRAPDLPLFSVSYSLGSLVVLESLRAPLAPAPAACVFLAPALALTFAASLIRLVTPFRALCTSMKSKAPADLRLRDATPLSEYDALLHMMDGVAQGNLPPAAVSIPTLILMSPKDEVVSYRKVAGLVQKRSGSQWAMRAVTPLKSDANHHLLIAERAVGSECWLEIVGMTLHHLSSHLR